MGHLILGTVEQIMGLLKQALSKEGMHLAYKAVWKNQGPAGVDGMGLDMPLFHLTKHWDNIKMQLMGGKYPPKPVLVRYG
jgi:retron-type reverse transcriptase